MQKNQKIRQKKKPILICVGNVKVPIYRRFQVRDTSGDKPKTLNFADIAQAKKASKQLAARLNERCMAVQKFFQVADYSDGTRKLRTFANEQTARDVANEIATKLANREGDVLTLKSVDRAAYVRALEFLRPTGVSLEVAAALFAEAHQKLGGRSLAEAVAFFIRRHPETLSQKTVKEVYDEMALAKKADGVSEVYLKDLKSRAGKFAEDFQCQIAHLTEAQINEWLRKLGCGPRARNNYRMSIATLIKFAESVSYVPKDHIDFSKIAKAKENESQIEIFTVEEMKKLLNAARLNVDELKPGYNLRYATGQGLIPLLTLGGFAGLRTAEILRQKWADINLERGFIRVTAAKGNTAQKRLVPISSNLRQWLSACPRTSDVCCDYERVEGAIERLSERAGIEWKHNALRHSFISYRLAEIQSVPQVALEAGNSPKMIFKHYRELVTPDEAKAWFGIVPPTPAKVPALPAAVAAQSPAEIGR